MNEEDAGRKRGQEKEKGDQQFRKIEDDPPITADRLSF
jgi:hypothetical protein